MSLTFFFIYETESVLFVYAFPFSTQVVLLHLEMMGKKRKRQGSLGNADKLRGSCLNAAKLRADVAAAAQAAKTSSRLALWMERVF